MLKGITALKQHEALLNNLAFSLHPFWSYMQGPPHIKSALTSCFRAAFCKWVDGNLWGTEVMTCEKSDKLDFYSLCQVKVKQGFSFLTYSGTASVSCDCSISVLLPV